MHAPTCFIADIHDLVHFCFLRSHRAQKEAALAQRAKDKAKKSKGGFFGFGGSKAPTKEEEEVDAEQDHDDKEEVMQCVEWIELVNVCAWCLSGVLWKKNSLYNSVGIFSWEKITPKECFF